MGQKSFRYRGVRSWNDLIDEAKKSQDVLGFQKDSFHKNKTIRAQQGSFHNIIDLTVESFSYYYFLTFYIVSLHCASCKFDKYTFIFIFRGSMHLVF